MFIFLSHLGDVGSTERGRARGNTFWGVISWFNQFSTLCMNEKMQLLEIIGQGGPGPTSPNSCYGPGHCATVVMSPCNPKSVYEQRRMYYVRLHYKCVNHV